MKRNQLHSAAFVSISVLACLAIFVAHGGLR